MTSAPTSKAPATKTKTKPAGGAPRKLSYNEQREFDSMEGTIMEAEEKLAAIDAEFALPDFYEKHKEDWKALEKEKKATGESIAALYARWEELEAIQTAYEESRRS